MAAVAAGRFREDLLARIQLWTFLLPGLAERREDIEPNLDYELGRATERVGTHVTTLFAVSRTKTASSNDADRLRKYLARFDLRFEHLLA